MTWMPIPPLHLIPKLDAASGTLRVMQVLHSQLNVIPLSAENAIRAGIFKRTGISIADVLTISGFSFLP
jgi:hypothetical protein